MLTIEHDISKIDKYFITPEYYVNNSRKYFSIIENILDNGIKLLQFRSKKISSDEYIKISKKIYKMCEKYNALYIINDYCNYKHNEFCHGIQLTAKNLINLEELSLKKNYYYFGSCHNEEEINICNNVDLIKMILISPIKDTSNKKGIGWKRFNNLANLSQKKVMALGGLNYEKDINTTKKNGGSGVAASSYFFELYNL